MHVICRRRARVGHAPCGRTRAAPPLFRQASLAAASQRGTGRVLVAAPPCASFAAALALLIVLLLAAALYLVEVPRRAPAVGVLMPPDGMVRITAPLAATVTRLLAAAGDDVRAGDHLVELSAAHTDIDGRPRVDVQHEALERDLEIAAQIHARRAAALADRQRGLHGRLAAAAGRIRIAARNVGAQAAAVTLQDARLQRYRALLERGLVATDAVAERAAAQLAAQVQLDAQRRELLDAEQARAALASDLDLLQHELDILQLDHARERERVLQQIRELSLQAAQRVVAPRAARIAHVAVNAGSDVRQGELLMTLFQPGNALEAWLYVSSADIGRLHAGQRVRLRLDAWPHQFFGAPAAVVTSISSSALEPQQLAVPLNLSGPVFEIRARLEDRTLSGLAARGALLPGTSFRADLIRHRYRLYEWLGRNLRDAVGGGAA